MNQIKIIQADITTAKVDAIVNAANEMLQGGGGVDGAIHRKAGRTLLDECEKLPLKNGMRCPFGEARITGAGNLDAKYVIHAVGPIYEDMKENADELLANAYKNALNLARENNCKSIAIPAISCGIFGFPVKRAAKIAIEICKLYEDLQITFYLRGNETFMAWKDAMNSKIVLENKAKFRLKKFFKNIFKKD